MKINMVQRLICCVILVICMSGSVYAENNDEVEKVSQLEPQYMLDELGIALDVPREVSYVFTQKESDYPQGIMSKEDINSMINSLKENDTYLSAISATKDSPTDTIDIKWKIVVSMLQDLTDNNVLGMTKTIEQQVRNILENSLMQSGYQDIEMGEYYSDYGTLRYVTAKYNVVGEEIIPRIEYATVFNGKLINFSLTCYKGELTSEAEIAFRELVDSVRPYMTENTPILQVQRNIMERLKNVLDTAGVDYSYDENSTSINMESNILFEFDQTTLTKEGKEYLDDFIPAYASIIFDKEFEGLISSINFEGHTDTSGSYEYNMNLSQRRAEEVMNYCLEILDDTYRNKMEKLAIAEGYSYENPIYKIDGEVDMDASRRVAISFTLDSSQF